MYNIIRSVESSNIPDQIYSANLTMIYAKIELSQLAFTWKRNGGEIIEQTEFIIVVCEEDGSGKIMYFISEIEENN